MKKRVRIYKAGGQSNAVSQEEVYKYIADEMSSEDYDGDTDAISEKLAQFGVDTQTADAYINEVGTYLEENNSNEVVDNNELTPEEQEAQQLALEEQNAAEEEARQAELYAMYNTDTEESVPDDNADEEIIMRQGGSKPSKRSFINQYTKLTKRQQGGNTPSPGADDVLGGREQHVSNFFKGIGESVNSAQQKQAAEEQYNAIYGNPQVGAYAQDGGIQQEQIDYENPMHHINAYATGIHDIFQNNQNIQNDAPKQQFEQYGGFTDTDSGLYKFIGGGDNESMDEQYQDSDLDYQRYAKRGGALHKYADKGEVGLYSPIDGHKYSDAEIAANQEQTDKTATPTDTEDYKKKYNELINQNTTDAQKQQQMMQQYMMQQYMQQMGNQGMFRSPIISRGEQYNKAVGSPYYTESGERYTGPDLAGRIPTSVDVTKKGIFGRPKQFTVNYGATPRISSFKAPIFTPGQNNTETSNTESASIESDKQEANINNSRVNNRQPLANMMMKSGIPGIKQLGARMTRSGAIPEIPQGTQPTTPATSSTSNEPYYPPMSSKAQRRENRDDRQLNRFLGNQEFDVFNDPKEVTRLKNKLGTYNEFKEYGGPVDYSQYAYGGDISVPELYKAQVGTQVAVDPNANNMSFANLQGFFAGTGAVDAEGNPIDATLPKSMQVDNITIDPNQPEGVSQKFRNKQAWDIDKAGIGDLSLLAANAFANTADEVRANRQENQMLENLTAAETNFGINNTYDQGDYDPNSGLFRPNKMGAMQSKYGGGIYAMGGNTMDEDEDTQYMTQEEIDDFIANGGELEYL
jgi:hypothetical protein